MISLTIATYTGAAVVRLYPGYGFATLTGLYIVSIAFFTAGIPLFPLIIGLIVSKGIIGVLDTPWFVWYKRYPGTTGPEKGGAGTCPPE
ncbi:MAG TPA: hypothetical protein PLG75_03560 [Methanoculleus sp.]|nr:hypothetical protein [Methanoculleus sp.]